MSVVYFVKHRRQDPIKIGYSSNLKQRLNDLKVSSPYGMDLIGTIKSPDAKGLESKIHKRLEAKRIQGEWFDISIQDAKDIASEFDEDYKSELKKLHSLLEHNDLSIDEVAETISLLKRNDLSIDDLTKIITLHLKRKEEIIGSLPQYIIDFMGENWVLKNDLLTLIQKRNRISPTWAYRNYNNELSPYFESKKEGKVVFLRLRTEGEEE